MNARKHLLALASAAALLCVACGDSQGKDDAEPTPVDTISGTTWVHQSHTGNQAEASTPIFYRLEKLVFDAQGNQGTYYFNIFRNSMEMDSLYQNGHQTFDYTFDAAAHAGSLDMPSQLPISWSDGSAAGYMFPFEGEYQLEGDSLTLITHYDLVGEQQSDTTRFGRP